MVEALRERTRRAVQQEIAEAAMQLFTDKGFDSTTIEQIAEAAGISRRSFFRYFETKEDVVVGGYPQVGEELRAALEARPIEESPWDALRETFLTMLKYDARETIAITRLCLETPTLQARHLEKHAQWKRLLTPNIQKRLGGKSDARAAAIIGSALACLDAATELWVQSDGKGDAVKMYDDAVAAVRG